MKRVFLPTCALSPLPCVMVSVGDMEKSNILTIAWTGIINSNPPRCYISVQPPRYSYDIIDKSGEFVINLVDDNLVDAADYCGTRSGRDHDKFAELGLDKVKGSEVNCPIIGQSPVSLECKVIEKVDLGTHRMFLADIVAVDISEEYLDDKGRPDYAKMNLVSYLTGSHSYAIIEGNEHIKRGLAKDKK